MNYKSVLILLAAMLVISCSRRTQIMRSIPSLANEIEVDGIINEKIWNEAEEFQNLLSPWIKDEQDKTIFKVFMTSDFFNFYFQVEDSTLVTFPIEKELTVDKEDRVELFFSKDSTLTKYFCIEIDPNGNILDYSARTYRQFDVNWNFRSKEIATKTSKDGYIVEGKISIKELKELGIENSFYLGVFRADFKDFESKDVTWFSWVNPNVSQPDFHIPSAFGQIFIKE